MGASHPPRMGWPRYRIAGVEYPMVCSPVCGGSLVWKPTMANVRWFGAGAFLACFTYLRMKPLYCAFMGTRVVRPYLFIGSTEPLGDLTKIPGGV